MKSLSLLQIPPAWNRATLFSTQAQTLDYILSGKPFIGCIVGPLFAIHNLVVKIENPYYMDLYI